MFFRRLKHIFKQGFQGLARNKAMGFASVTSIVLVLLVLGFVLLLVLNINEITEKNKEKLNEVIVFLKDDLTEEQLNLFENYLSGLAHVESVEFESKEEAFENMVTQLAENNYIMDGIEENPLPSSFMLKVDDIENTHGVVSQVEGKPEVEMTRYFSTVIDKMVKLSESIRYGGMVIIVILLFISVFLISNTIKLTVMNRRKEIEIMKDVGATNGHIRGPFVVEGVSLGVIAAIIASFVVYSGYTMAFDALSSEEANLFSLRFVHPKSIYQDLVLIFLTIGAGVGAIGSMISMKRFLKV